jgi:hypothetical protein
MRVLIVSIPLLAFGVLANAAETYNGDAYSLDGGRLLYRESHYLFEADGVQQRLVLYRCPDGRPFARKHVNESGNAEAPDFDLQDARIGYQEGVRGHGDSREVFVQLSADKPEQSGPLHVPGDSVIDAGFDAYVHRHWNELAARDTLRFSFLVPSKSSFYMFKLGSVPEASDNRKLTLRLALGAWWAFVLPHIDVEYDRSTRRLLSYAGLTNIRDGALKNISAHVVFPLPPAPVDAAAIDMALTVPLSNSCDVMVPVPAK